MNKNNTYDPNIMKQIVELMDKKNDDWMYNVFNRNKISSPTSHSTSLTNNKLKVIESISKKFVV